jgi:hypothetical protein
MTAVFALAHGKIVQIRWFWHREDALATGDADVDNR